MTARGLVLLRARRPARGPADRPDALAGRTSRADSAEAGDRRHAARGHATPDRSGASCGPGRDSQPAFLGSTALPAVPGAPTLPHAAGAAVAPPMRPPHRRWRPRRPREARLWLYAAATRPRVWLLRHLHNPAWVSAPPIIQDEETALSDKAVYFMHKHRSRKTKRARLSRCVRFSQDMVELLDQPHCMPALSPLPQRFPPPAPGALVWWHSTETGRRWPGHLHNPIQPVAYQGSIVHVQYFTFQSSGRTERVRLSRAVGTR